MIRMMGGEGTIYHCLQGVPRMATVVFWKCNGVLDSSVVLGFKDGSWIYPRGLCLGRLKDSARSQESSTTV